MMRMSGKTSRAIDYAVQDLFKFGKIYIPSKSELKERTQLRTIIEYCQVDPDADIGLAQRDFRVRVLRRLYSEHNGQIELEGNWIKIKGYDIREQI